MMCDAAQMLPDFWTMAVGVNQRELKAHRGHSLRKLPVRYPALAYGGRPAVNVQTLLLKVYWAEFVLH